MDNFAYLDQISASTNATNSSVAPGNSFFGALFGKKSTRILLLSAVVAIILCIIFAIINSIVNRETDYVPRLSLRTTNLSSMVTEYTPTVKSSSLRAAGSSLASILDNMSSNLTTSLGEDYEVSEPVAKEEAEVLSSLTTALYEAKINGVLDRTYARQFAYQIVNLLALIEEAKNSTDDATLKTKLTSSEESLSNIYPAFADYSDTTK